MISSLGLIRLAFYNLRINKLRSSLTLLGMVFGTGAVIATLSSNEGAARFIRTELEKLGTNVVVVQGTEGGHQVDEMDRALLKKYADAFSSLSLVMSVPGANIRFHSQVKPTQILGIEANYSVATRMTLQTGRFFDDFENNHAAFLTVLGSEVKAELFGKDNAMGKLVHVFIGPNAHLFEVIGVVKAKGNALDSSIFIPNRTASLLSPENRSGVSLAAVLANENFATRGKEQALTLLKRRYPTSLVVSDARESIERTKNIWGKQNLVGICLAFISLLTGGVGIMNIMLLSVSQRKKEIGLRKAVGANDGHILAQFLMEAMIICLAGGILGICVGILFGQRVAEMMGQWKAEISISTILMALGFSMLTGVVFGLLPAIRAARLDPYEALRG